MVEHELEEEIGGLKMGTLDGGVNSEVSTLGRVTVEWRVGPGWVNVSDYLYKDCNLPSPL
jgi:hypothetical protein